MRLKDLGEDEILRHLRPLVARANVLPNDDASAIKLNDSELLLLNVDGFVASTDAPPGMPYRCFGEKVALMAVSDIVVKGGKTFGLLLSVSVPQDFHLADLKEIIQGAKEFSEEFGIPFLGGDLNQAEDIVLDAIAVATVSNDKVIRRSGAQIGDMIVSPKWFGLTSVGLGYLLSGNNYDLSKETLEKAIHEVYSPRPWFSEFAKLTSTISITASIDSSDGLGKSLHHLAKANKKRFVISNLPLHPLLEKQLARKYWFSAVFYGGEEFCPIFTIPSEDTKCLLDEFVVIGRVEEGKGVVFSSEEVTHEILPKGWQHFEE